jgi:hypothetical protein
MIRCRMYGRIRLNRARPLVDLKTPQTALAE